MQKLFLVIGVKKLVWLSVLFLLLTFPALAQSDYRADGFVGYSFLRNEGTSQSVNTNGWHGGISADFVKGFGFAVEVSGHYGSLTQYTVLAGPRFTLSGNRASVFSQFMVGFANLRGNLQEFGVPPENKSKTFRVESFGGGLDIHLNKKFAVRVFQADIIFNHPIPGRTDMNIRLSSGIVYRFSK